MKKAVDSSAADGSSKKRRAFDVTVEKAIRDAGYTTPEWGDDTAGLSMEHRVETMKDGVLVGEPIVVDYSPVLLGRIPLCDIEQQHASISRFHCMLQFGKGKWHLFDLGSTHGTKVNKHRVESRRFIEVPHGSSIQLGASSRTLILSYPYEFDDDYDDSTSKLATVQEKTNKHSKSARDIGKQSSRDHAHLLKEWLRYNGYDDQLDLSFMSVAGGDFKGTLKLTILSDDQDYDYLFLEDTGHSKADIIQKVCASAIEKLKSLSLYHVGEKRRRKEYQASDDEVLDLTAGENRSARMGIITHESLLKDKEDAQDELSGLLKQLGAAEQSGGNAQDVEGDDELDAFMADLNANVKNETVNSLKKKIRTVEERMQELDRLISVAAPMDWSAKDSATSGLPSKKPKGLTGAALAE